MNQRGQRVNQLVLEAISTILRADYQAESVYITITEVTVSSDLRQATLFYSVLGDSLRQREAGAFLNKIKRDLRHRLSRAIVLKYLPNLRFVYDPGIAKGAYLNRLLDQL